MKCEDLVAYLSEYIDNDLDEDLTTEAQSHLAICHNCRVMLDTTQKMIVIYRQQQKQVIPAARRQRLFDQLQSAFLNNPETAS